VIDSRFEELDFHEHELVIQALQLLQQAIDESEGVIVGGFVHVELNETGFEVLSKETSTFGRGPFDA